MDRLDQKVPKMRKRASAEAVSHRRIERLIDEILAELSDQDSLRALLGYGHSFIEVLPLATKLREIQEFHLLQGLLLAQSRQFFARMQTEPDGKRALAEYCYNSCGLKEVVAGGSDRVGDKHRIFFESGSTIAHLIGYLAKRIYGRADGTRSGTSRKRGAKDLLPVTARIMTNNLAGVTALPGLVSELNTAS